MNSLGGSLFKYNDPADIIYIIPAYKLILGHLIKNDQPHSKSKKYNT